MPARTPVGISACVRIASFASCTGGAPSETGEFCAAHSAHPNAYFTLTIAATTHAASPTPAALRTIPRISE
jgi:hypothetical protein